MPNILGYHHVSLSVTDLEKSVGWYCDVLGFEVQAELDGTGFQRTRLRAPASGLILTLTRHDSESAEQFDERRPGLDHISFHVGETQDVEALRDWFDQHGVIHSGVKTAASGSAMITLRDPDNIQLEVFSGAVNSAMAAGRQTS